MRYRLSSLVRVDSTHLNVGKSSTVTVWTSGFLERSLTCWYHYQLVSDRKVRQIIDQKRRLMLFGHFARMDESADAIRIFSSVPQSDWKMPAGLLRTPSYVLSCLTMKNDLSSHNLSVEDATELAADKLLWRLLAASRAACWNSASQTMMMMMMMHFSSNPILTRTTKKEHT